MKAAATILFVLFLACSADVQAQFTKYEATSKVSFQLPQERLYEMEGQPFAMDPDQLINNWSIHNTMSRTDSYNNYGGLGGSCVGEAIVAGTLLYMFNGFKMPTYDKYDLEEYEERLRGY